MSTRGSGASRAGGESFHNEDAFLVEDGLGLYVVCDGASDAPGGEVAARLASQAVEEFVERAGEEFDLDAGPVALSVVERAMDYALTALRDAEASEPELKGLTTTVTLLLAHGRVGVVGHRGDSRAYLIRNRRSHLLTLDHELTRDSAEDIGDTEIDVFSLELEPGDTLVLCTDGAEAVVQDRALVGVAGSLSPRVLASRIVSAANRLLPDQDATVVVVRVREVREPGWLELSALPQGTAFGHALERT